MTDRAFIDDMDRAARSLRAAVASALTQGVTEDTIRRIVEDGLDDGYALRVTRHSQRRAAQLGHQPSGEPLPLPPMDDEYFGPVDEFGNPVPRLFSNRGTYAA